MTCIVGVKCEDGAVLGADTSATYGTQLGQLQTIRQDTATKLLVACNQVALGVSGPITLSQHYSAEIETYVRGQGNRVRWRNIEEAKAALSKMFWSHAGPMWDKAALVGKSVGGAAVGEVNHATAVALPVADSAHLLQFTTQCNAEEVTTDLPFMSIGSGQHIADPFLAFLRRVFWSSGLPSLLDGQLATVWTLDHVIRVNAGGVGGNIQLVVLKRDASGRNWTCNAIPAEEVDEHRRSVGNIERKMVELPALSSFDVVPSPPTLEEEGSLEEAAHAEDAESARAEPIP